MDFEIIGEIRDVEPIAVGRSIRDMERLNKIYGLGRWRKLKGIATVRLIDGTIHGRSALVRGPWTWTQRHQA